MDFLKEIAVGSKSAKSYPPGHPVMLRVVTSTLQQLAKLYTEISEFSMYFLETTVIFQDVRIDVGKNPAMLSLLDVLRKIELNSLTFEPGVTNDDIKNLYEVLVSPKLKIKEYGDAATMLNAKGTQKIKINAVKFGVQTGTSTQVAKESSGGTGGKEHAEIMGAIANLKSLVEKGLSFLDTKPQFEQVLNDIEGQPAEAQKAYHDDLARIINGLPPDQQVEFLRELEPKAVTLKMLSNLSDETLINLIFAKSEDKKDDDIKRIISVIEDDKFADLMPKLKEKIPNIYEYLAQVGLLLSEKFTSIVSRDDLRVAMKPYYSMLDSNSTSIREEGTKALVTLATRFMEQKNFELAEEIILRVSTALGNESVVEVPMRLTNDLGALYKVSKENDQKNSCSLILDPFSKILGRGGLSLTYQKQIIKFFSETGSSEVLPVLFSFLWETGIYPEVRTAIIKFGKDAVTEALLTLREAEDPGLSRKLVDILKNIGREGIEMLIRNLDSSEWFLKRNILAILGDVGEKSIVERVVPLLQDVDDRVRLELVRTFEKLEYNEGLLRALNDNSLEVKAQALHGLRKTITNEKVIELLPLLKQRGDALHTELLKLIGEKKISESVEMIIECVKSLELRNDPASLPLKELCIATLVKLRVENLKDILEKFRRSKDKRLAYFAKNALRRLA